MVEIEVASQALIPPKDFSPETVAKCRKLMHDALALKGVRTVRHLLPEYHGHEYADGIHTPPYWELNAWGLTTEEEYARHG